MELFNKIKNKDIFFITTIMYLGIILLYEFLYCNFEYFTEQIQDYNFSIYRIVIYVLSYCVFLKFKNTLIDEAIDSLKSKVKCFFLVIMFVFTIVLFIYLSINAMKDFNINIIIALLSLLMFNLFAIYVSSNIIKNAIITSVLIGSIYSIAIPFNNQLDEKRHFLSVYSITIGELDMKNAKADKSLIEMPRKMTASDFLKYYSAKPSGEIISDFSGLEKEDTPNEYYISLSHFASALGVLISKSLEGSIADIYIAGRCFNLILYTVLIALTFKILPYKKHIFYSIFFMPMLIALSSVYSADGVGTALIALLIAYCLKVAEKETVNIKEILLLLLLMALAALIKGMGYAGIMLIVFIVPLKSIILHNKQYMKYIIPLVIVLFTGIILMGKASMNEPGDTRGGDATNPTMQLQYIIDNPLNYGSTLITQTMLVFLDIDALSYFNAPMFFDTTYKIVFIIMAIYLIIISLMDSSKQLSKKDRFIFLLTFLVIYVITSTAMYLSYTNVGANYINGYQQRYFFPILALILMSISVKLFEIKVDEKKMNLYIAYPMVIFSIISIMDLTII